MPSARQLCVFGLPFCVCSGDETGMLTRSRATGKKKPFKDYDSEESDVSSFDLDGSAEEDVYSEPSSLYERSPILNPNHPVWSENWHRKPTTLNLWLAVFEKRKGANFVQSNTKTLEALFKARFYNDPYFLGIGTRPESTFLFPHHHGYLVSHGLFLHDCRSCFN